VCTVKLSCQSFEIISFPFDCSVKPCDMSLVLQTMGPHLHACPLQCGSAFRCILSHGGIATWMHGACRQYLPFTAASSHINASFEIPQCSSTARVLTGLLAWEHLNREPKYYYISSSHLMILISSHPHFPFSSFLLSLPQSKRDAVGLKNCTHFAIVC
jgi:hypothetical protein